MTDTIRNALTIVTKDSDVSQVNLRNTQVGLSMVLIGLAEKQSSRVAHLASVTADLEQKVFSAEQIKDMDARTAVTMYKLAGENLQTSANFVQSVLSGMKWRDLEASVAEMAARREVVETENDKEFKDVAQSILKELVKMNQETLIEPDLDGSSDFDSDPHFNN